MNKKRLMIFYLVPVLLILFLSGETDNVLTIRGTLEGAVFNESGDPVSGAKVTIKGVGSNNEIRTDGQGRFKIKDLAAGVYETSLESSSPDLAVRQETDIHLGKVTCVTLVTRSGPSDGVPGIIARPAYVRDALGRVLHQEILIGDKFYSMDYTYDAEGRVSAARDNSNKEWRYEYTASGKIKKVTRPDGKIILYNYSTAGDLWKIDLPWGYKIFYSIEKNRFTKAVKKFKNLTLFEFAYTLDNDGNKVKVDEGSSNKAQFEYSYDGNSRPKEIRNRRTGEKNAAVYEYKGHVRNAALRGVIERKNDKYADKNWEYEFDGRENIIHQREKKGDWRSEGNITYETC